MNEGMRLEREENPDVLVEKYVEGLSPPIMSALYPSALVQPPLIILFVC